MGGRRSRRDEDRSRDTQEVFDWEPRTVLDRVLYRGYPYLKKGGRLGVVLVALWLLVVHFEPTDFAPVTDPFIAGFVLLSVVPALALVGYVWYADITGPGPLGLLVVTFTLGLLFANFAAVANEIGGDVLVFFLRERGASRSLSTVALFVLVVAPAEEVVKLFAVQFYAYRSQEFDSVISGAVFGAVAGLGFATIENAFYITRVVSDTDGLIQTLTDGSAIATLRALAGPGHVIWSAIAGYYLGLARFNRHHAGPIILKGLLLAIVFHSLYNILVTDLLGTVTDLTGFAPTAVFFTFAIGYNGILFAFLIYKLSQYRAVHRETYPESGIESQMTEFDP